MAQKQPPNPFLLAADNPAQLVAFLHANPTVASAQDWTGYSLLHAASSYNHPTLLRALVKDFHVDVNITDDDGETPLFSCETVEMAKCLVEEMGANWSVKNKQGMSAREKIEQEGDWPLVGLYLGGIEDSSAPTQTTTGSLPPPQLSVNVTTIDDPASTADTNSANPTEAEVIDPAFKARIEALAARPDFQGEEGQKELRNLVAEAVRGHVISPARDKEGEAEADRDFVRQRRE
ncbi:hypothetical protein FGG08_005594 [Glutinoglossum americanum]|uniref:Ankyrin repeat protein n=1 Tax=Glutinoglossum americanum TaxID=1670608 RepID=A0A9P8I2Z6_9PEZI|nr:hypothetical protein FGG08_005594 [Glutinoglossum americanum]